MKQFKNPYLQHEYDLYEGKHESKNPYLQHGWGTKPEQKRKEKEYNQKYYQAHKEKWGVGQHLKAFGSSVKESLQKHNENWQSGMDTILRKNYTQTPTSSIQNKKVNPYKATGMAANAQSSGKTPSPSQIAQIKRDSSKSAQRSNAYAQSERARMNDAAKKYRRQNASSARAKAQQDSAVAAEKQAKFKAEQYQNAKKIEQMHKKFEADQNNLRWNKDKKIQQDAMDIEQKRKELQAHSNHYKNEAKKQEEFKAASKYLATIERNKKTLDNNYKHYTDKYSEAYSYYEKAMSRVDDMKSKLTDIKNGSLVARDSKGNAITPDQYEQRIKLLEEEAKKAKNIADSYDEKLKQTQALRKKQDDDKEYFTDYIHNQNNYKVTEDGRYQRRTK